MHCKLKVVPSLILFLILVGFGSPANAQLERFEGYYDGYVDDTSPVDLRFKINFDGPVTINSLHSTYLQDPLGQLFRVNSDGSKTLLASNDDSGEGRNFRIKFVAEKGSEYFVRVFSRRPWIYHVHVTADIVQLKRIGHFETERLNPEYDNVAGKKGRPGPTSVNVGTDFGYVGSYFGESTRGFVADRIGRPVCFFSEISGAGGEIGFYRPIDAEILGADASSFDVDVTRTGGWGPRSSKIHVSFRPRGLGRKRAILRIAYSHSIGGPECDDGIYYADFALTGIGVSNSESLRILAADHGSSTYVNNRVDPSARAKFHNFTPPADATEAWVYVIASDRSVDLTSGLYRNSGDNLEEHFESLSRSFRYKNFELDGPFDIKVQMNPELPAFTYYEIFVIYN